MAAVTQLRAARAMPDPEAQSPRADAVAGEGTAERARMSEAQVDQLLVERVQKGDKKAFDLLINKYQHRIVSLVSRYVADPADAMDVAQEAFIKAYRAIGRFRGDSAFYTWLYRIAINTAKNWLVARKRRPPTSDIDAADAVASGDLVQLDHQLVRRQRLAIDGDGYALAPEMEGSPA